MRAGGAQLYYRDVGTGQPIVVLHGGPDFDHSYLVPELDGLAASFRLIYYDQRGRGRSADGVQPDDITVQSEVADLDAVRHHFELESVAVLGHSWGAVIAMEYATRRPDRVSHLVLLNPAPASHDDAVLLRDHLHRLRPARDVERMQAISATDRYQQGDIDAEAEYYRIHYRPALRSPEQIATSSPGCVRTSPSKGSSRRGGSRTGCTPRRGRWRATTSFPGFGEAAIPTLVVHGADDFIPFEVSEHIAQAVPGALLRVLPEGTSPTSSNPIKSTSTSPNCSPAADTRSAKIRA